MRRKRQKVLYIDALALVPHHKSGVGQTIEQTLYALAPLLYKEGWKIKLVVPAGKAGRMKPYAGIRGVSIKTIPIPARPFNILLRIGVLPPIDCVLGKGIYLFPNYRNWPLWSSRAITYIYDLGYLLYPDTVQPQNQRYLSRHVVNWIARSETIVTITKTVKKEIVQYLQVSAERVIVVYCAVDKKLFYERSSIEVQKAKQKYDIPYDRYLLFVGNIEPRKNLLKLLEAYSMLPKAILNDYGLVIIGGDGWVNDDFYITLEQLRSEGKKIFKVKKYVTNEDLPAIYSGAAALVQPAIYEGFGMTIIEAMATRTPVVASEIPAIKEVAGTAVKFFDPMDARSIAESIKLVLSDNNRTHSLISRGEHRAKGFSWQNSAEVLKRNIDELWAKGPRPHSLKLIIASMNGRLARGAKSLDKVVRDSLGDKPQSNYAPEKANSLEELRRTVYDDFNSEQPMIVQVYLFEVYVYIKRFTTAVTKALIKFTKSVAGK